MRDSLSSYSETASDVNTIYRGFLLVVELIEPFEYFCISRSHRVIAGVKVHISRVSATILD